MRFFFTKVNVQLESQEEYPCVNVISAVGDARRIATCLIKYIGLPAPWSIPTLIIVGKNGVFLPKRHQGDSFYCGVFSYTGVHDN